MASAGEGRLQLYAPHNGTDGNGLWVRTGWNADYDAWNEIAIQSRSFTNNVDLRAPIFYDSNDTAFYLNPNDFSLLNRVSSYTAARDTNANWNTGFTNTPANSYAWHGDLNGGTNAAATGWWFYESMRHSNSGNFWGTQIAWGWEDNANRLLQRNVAAGGFSAWVEYLNTSGRTFTGDLIMGSSLRAPIFYDSNNTSYYIDAASTSSLAALIMASTAANALSVAGGIHISTSNVTGSGIILADDGDIVDLNDGYCAMRFSQGVRIHGGNRTGSAVITLASGGDITAIGNITAYSDIRLKKDITKIKMQ
jgi:hypothetical protein